MKKKILLLAATALLSMSYVKAQDTAKHVPFLSAGMNYSPKTTNSMSFEVGAWGTTSNTSYSLTYDFVPDQTSPGMYRQWLGVKGYWTTHDESKLCYMVYLAPKVCINSAPNTNHELLEFGFNPYYKLNSYLFLGVCLSNQYMGSDSPWNIGASAGLTFLINGIHLN